MFLDQFRDFMILVLIAAAIVSGIIGEASDTIAIIVILVLNAVLGFTQEYRADRAMAALKKMAAVHATVLRGGNPLAIPASELVPGDIVLLDAGKVVPADLRVQRVRRADGGGGRAHRRIHARWKKTATVFPTRRSPWATGRTCSIRGHSSPTAAAGAS